MITVPTGFPSADEESVVLVPRQCSKLLQIFLDTSQHRFVVEDSKRIKIAKEATYCVPVLCSQVSSESYISGVLRAASVQSPVVEELL